MPLQHIRLLFAIADGEHARFVRPDGEDNTLRSFNRVNPQEGREGTASHPHAQDKQKFAAWVAEQLAHDAASYDELVLVAPAHMLSAIQDHLPRTVKDKIAGTLEKDLAKIPGHDLWPHLKQWVRPVHRAKLL